MLTLTGANPSMGCSITRPAMTGVKLCCSFLGGVLVFSARMGWFFYAGYTQMNLISFSTICNVDCKLHTIAATFHWDTLQIHFY